MTTTANSSAGAQQSSPAVSSPRLASSQAVSWVTWAPPAELRWKEAWSSPYYPRDVFFAASMLVIDVYGRRMRPGGQVRSMLMTLMQRYEVRLPKVKLEPAREKGVVTSYASANADASAWPTRLDPPEYDRQLWRDDRMASCGAVPWLDLEGEWFIILQQSASPWKKEANQQKLDPMRGRPRACGDGLESSFEAAARETWSESCHTLTLAPSDLKSCPCIDGKAHSPADTGALYHLAIEGDTSRWLDEKSAESLNQLFHSNRAILLEQAENGEVLNGVKWETRLEELRRTEDIWICSVDRMLSGFHKLAAAYERTGQPEREWVAMPRERPFHAFVRHLPPDTTTEELMRALNSPKLTHSFIRIRKSVPPFTLPTAYLSFCTAKGLASALELHGTFLRPGIRLDITVCKPRGELEKRRDEVCGFRGRVHDGAKKYDQQPWKQQAQENAEIKEMEDRMASAKLI